MSFAFIPCAANSWMDAATGIVGPGKFTSLGLDLNPSRLPVGTENLGPPANATESLVARVTMSEHETVRGQAASRSLLASSMIS